MAEQRKFGGAGHRNPDRSQYVIKRHHSKAKPPPSNFREQFLEHGYEAQWIYSCRWPVFARWIDECGGEELLAARKEWLRVHGRSNNRVHHAKGWTAERLDQLHR